MLEAFFPPLCLACDVVLPSAQSFCADCWTQVEPLAAPGCARCSEPGRFVGGVCRRCRSRSPAFSRAWAPYEHAGPIARAIHRFKYEDLPQLAGELAALWRAPATAFARAPTAVVPVPLHRRRHRERGFDQAFLLAHAFAASARLPLRCEALVRSRQTRRQVGLTDAERVLNLSGAFDAGEGIEGEHVLLIDDVLTTGATADAAAAVLRRSGARSVQVLTLARARREDT